MDPIITLNVGGTIVKTKQSTLLKSEYFEALLTRWVPSDEIFIDVDYALFKHVLNKIRDPQYVMPVTDNYNIQNMYSYYAGGNVIPAPDYKTNAWSVNMLGDQKIVYNPNIHIVDIRIIYKDYPTSFTWQPDPVFCQLYEKNVEGAVMNIFLKCAPAAMDLFFIKKEEGTNVTFILKPEYIEELNTWHKEHTLHIFAAYWNNHKYLGEVYVTTKKLFFVFYMSAMP